MKINELHPEVWEALDARRARLPHALLFSGQRGIGKLALAEAFAKSLLCESPLASGEACGHCAACVWMSQGNHPDFRLIQPEVLQTEVGEATEAASKKKPSEQITIDAIRALETFLHVGTHRQGARVILIYPAEAMNRATANALLKSLEEPISGTLFILVSHERARLLPTIRSRCQSVLIPLPSPARALAWMQEIEGGRGAEMLALSGGAPFLAQSLMGSDEKAMIQALLEAFSQGKTMNPLSTAATLDRFLKSEKRMAPLQHFITWAQKWVFDLALANAGQPLRYFLSHETILKRLSQETHLKSLLAFFRKTIQYRLQCEQPLNSRLFLEEFFMNYARVFVLSAGPYAQR